MELAPGGGGGAPAWTGSIQVVPGHLEASAPGFSAGGNQVLVAMASVLGWSDPGGPGITDAGAAAAWSRLATIWNGDLSNLSDEYLQVATALYGAAGSYQGTDQSVMGGGG